MEYVPIVIRQGDYLARLALRHGFDASSVWNHPKNKALRNARPNRGILAPGDVLYIPAPQPKWLPVAVGAVNRFVGNVPTTQVDVVLRDAAYVPLSNQKCTVGVEGSSMPLTTDGDGKLTVVVPTTAASIEVVVEDGPCYTLNVAHVDPVDTSSGLLQRLASLGFVRPTESFSTEVQIAVALMAFQRSRGLEATGQVDPATLAALTALHGG